MRCAKNTLKNRVMRVTAGFWIAGGSYVLAERLTTVLLKATVLLQKTRDLFRLKRGGIRDNDDKLKNE